MTDYIVGGQRGDMQQEYSFHMIALLYFFSDARTTDARSFCCMLDYECIWRLKRADQ